MLHLPRVHGRRQMIVLVVCALLSSGIVQAAPVLLTEESSTDAPFPAEGGLTRNTLEEAARSPVPATGQQPRQRQRTRSVSARRSARARLASEQRAAWHDARRRNVLESFVYWWNGWVVHHFHTHSGTVMIDRIGFKS